jgi:hypothetical protein
LLFFIGKKRHCKFLNQNFVGVVNLCNIIKNFFSGHTVLQNKYIFNIIGISAILNIANLRYTNEPWLTNLRYNFRQDKLWTQKTLFWTNPGHNKPCTGQTLDTTNITLFPGLLCPGFVMSRVCHVLDLSAQDLLVYPLVAHTKHQYTKHQNTKY